MWLYTKYGFYSVVCARAGKGRKTDPIDLSRLMVRARTRAHLKNLIERFPLLNHCPISANIGTDYPFRIFVPKTMWSSVLLELGMEVDYDNFKQAVGARVREVGGTYCNVLHDVWEATSGLPE